MQPWAWLAAYIVGFGLLQALLYRRFHQQTATAEPPGGSVEPAGGNRLPSTGAAETTACQHCDTVNENHRMVQYCRSCAEPLR